MPDLLRNSDNPPLTNNPVTWKIWLHRLLPWLLGLIAFFIYQQGSYYRSGDVIPTELLPVSLLTDGDLYLDETYGGQKYLPYYLVLREGHVISYYPIITPLLNVPRVWMDRQKVLPRTTPPRLAFDTACTIAALSVVFMVYVFYGLGLSTGTSMFFGLLYAFGTSVWSIGSQALWQHGPSILFLAGAIALLLRNNRWLPMAGLLLGLAVFNRPSNGLFAVPLTIFVLIHHRPRALWFIFWAAIPALLMGYYSYVCWGNILSFGQGHGYNGIHGPHAIGFSYPFFQGITNMLFSPSRGLFIYTPVLLFAIPVWILSLWSSKEQPILRYLAIGTALDLILFSKWQVWWGGFSYGYRMLLEMVPGLVIFLAVYWQRLGSVKRNKALLGKAIIIALIPFGIYIQYLGAFYYNNDWNTNPVNIDLPQAQERLWDWKDSQWLRYHRMLIKGDKVSDGPYHMIYRFKTEKN